MGSSRQSAGHAQESSPASHLPFPQQTPQSSGQDPHPSVSSQVPSPQTAGHDPQASHASEQQVPSITQVGPQPHPPPLPPHWQGEHAAGSSGQSAGQEHELSFC